MLRLDKIIKPWKDAGSLNAKVNLYGFWDEESFSRVAETWVFFSVCGVDFKSLIEAE